MKHDPTKGHTPTFEFANAKGASHGTPFKELNAMGSAVDKKVVLSSNSGFSKSIKSPVNVRQINSFKSEQHGNFSVKPVHHTAPESGFSSSQIPNTKTTVFEKNTEKHQRKSRSFVFHN